MLTLNDEQEKALREWYGLYVVSGDAHVLGQRADLIHFRRENLLCAIAPLMKPWRVARNMSGVPEITNVSSCLNLAIHVNGVGFFESMKVAERITNLLNESEAAK